MDDAVAQTQAAAQAWGDVQKQMWDSWMKLMQAAPTLDPAIAEQWQSMAEKNMEAWMAGAEPLVQATAAQAMAGQQAMNSFFQQLAQGWQQAGNPAAWQEMFTGYLSDLQRQAMTNPLGLFNSNWGAMPGAMSGASLAMDTWQKMMGAVAPSLAGFTMPGFSPESMGEWLMGGDVVNRTFNAYQQTVGQFLDSPPMGYAREYDERVRGLAKAYLNFQEASAKYQALVGKAWVNAIGSFQNELIKRSEQDDPITSLQELNDTWYAVADGAFSEIFIEEEFVRTQGDLLTATLQLRVKQREIVEIVSKALDIPTRTEVDEAHKSIYTQRKEIKSLRKMVTEMQAEIAELKRAPKPAAKKTTRNSTAKKSPAAKKSSSAASTQSTAKDEA